MQERERCYRTVPCGNLRSALSTNGAAPRTAIRVAEQLMEEASPVAAGFDSAMWPPSDFDSATRSYREGAALADNVSAVYEVPELTAGQRRDFHAHLKLPFSLAAWQGREAAAA